MLGFEGGNNQLPNHFQKRRDSLPISTKPIGNDKKKKLYEAQG